MRLRDGTDVEDVRLDRLVQFDDRSRRYGAVRAADEPLEQRHWSCDVVLDQGNEGACVGYSLTHDLIAEPLDTEMRATKRVPFARRVYRRAKRIDEWPGTGYEGTSVLAGCKVLRRAGAIDRYEWAFGLYEVLKVVSNEGPVVLGIAWYESMYAAPDGRVAVEGSVAGGHAIVCNGINPEAETVTLHNSWGPDWGSGGEAELGWGDLDRLLSEQGEAVRLIRSARGKR